MIRSFYLAPALLAAALAFGTAASADTCTRQSNGDWRCEPSAASVPTPALVEMPGYATLKCWQPSLFGGYWRYFTVPLGAGCPAEYVPPAGVDVYIQLGHPQYHPWHY